MIRILIVDDHPIICEGLRQILQRTSDLNVVGAVYTGRDALQQVLEQKIDLVLLDIAMPGRNGLEILSDLKRLKPSLPVLVLSMHAEAQYAGRALKAKASGYLTKATAAEELITAIRKVAQGGKYLSAAFAAELVYEAGSEKSTKALHETLSDREFQVMCRIAAGCTVKEIGEEMSLSVKTVSTYRRRLLDKMLLKNNAEVVRYVMQHGLVKPTGET